MGPQRQKFISLVARKLHTEQPWYHGNISREDADAMMNQSAHHDGKFLYVSLFINQPVHFIVLKTLKILQVIRVV